MGYTDYNDLLILFRACLDADYYTVEESGSFSLVRDGERLYVFFEKSEGREDWQNNFDFASEAEKYGREGESFYVHRGFLRVWESILPYIKGALLDLSIREIVSVGYSHGAALAVLCHEYVWYERPDLRGRIFGFGFGCPRVIYGRVQREKERWADFYVIRNYDDIVTHLPPRALGYRHVGQMVVIGKAGKYSRIDAHRAESYIRELEDYPS
ncbi:MAG: hypothetical protein ACI3X1_04070 [Eubacteriales bacterium]